MLTLTDNDQIDRFTTLDHAILEEVQAIVEAHGGLGPLSPEVTVAATSGEHAARHVSWMRAALDRFHCARATR
jgi:hypothetical protein